jgi:hypothetical protein
LDFKTSHSHKNSISSSFKLHQTHFSIAFLHKSKKSCLKLESTITLSSFTTISLIGFILFCFSKSSSSLNQQEVKSNSNVIGINNLNIIYF